MAILGSGLQSTLNVNRRCVSLGPGVFVRTVPRAYGSCTRIPGCRSLAFMFKYTTQNANCQVILKPQTSDTDTCHQLYEHRPREFAP